MHDLTTEKKWMIYCSRMQVSVCTASQGIPVCLPPHNIVKMRSSNSILNNIPVNQDIGSCSLAYYWLMQMPPSLTFFFW